MILEKISQFCIQRVWNLYQSCVLILQKKENIQNALLLVAALISGLAAVMYAKLFKYSERFVFDLLVGKEEYIFLTTPILFLGAWWVVHKYSPEASGSGIPQVLLSNELDDDGIHKKHIGRFLSFRVIIVKTVSSILCVLGGGAIGREGPTIQISASIFYLFGEKMKRYLAESKSHIWIISGASAGLAAAFNTPLGGIIYAIEELGATHFSRIRTILLTAIITSGLVSLWLSGNYLYLGFPVIQFEGLSIIPMALLVGIVSGLAGGVFSTLLFKLSSARRKIKSASKLAMIATGCGLIMAALIYFDQKAASSGVEMLNEFLFHGESASATFVLLRFFGPIVSYLCGSAGGIFSPSLA
ncbi:MAG: chloride channel protein, partial [Bdellovibrionaceae bacterium]|nr:chloride channel protein [Pseudobdellovibrionaceae bacterium]